MHSLTIEDLGSSNKGRQGQAPTMTWKRVIDPSQMIECPNDKKPEGTINMVYSSEFATPSRPADNYFYIL